MNPNEQKIIDSIKNSVKKINKEILKFITFHGTNCLIRLQNE